MILSFLQLDGYVSELRKWTAVAELAKIGFPVGENLSKYIDMDEERIYNQLEARLNHIFVNASSDVKSYNVFENMYEFIEELNEGQSSGMLFHNADRLNSEIGGFNLNGNIYGLGAGSGVGKSTMAFNYIIPSAIENGEKVVMIINEEDEGKMRKELLIWVANNIILKDKKDEYLQKRTLRDGDFKKETLDLLLEC